MTARTFASALVFSISLVACGEPSMPGAPGTPEAPDASVPDTPAAFALAVTNPKLPILTGSTGTFDVTLTRMAPFTGAVTISVDGLPPGVSAQPVTIEAGATTAMIELRAETGAVHSLPTTVSIAGMAGSVRATTDATVTITGAPGMLDQSFTNPLTPMSAGEDYAYATAVQPDGKILIAGRANADFAVLRLLRDGAPDPSFGSGGKVVTDFGGSDSAHAIAIQPDGKIVVAGSAAVADWGMDFAIARYLPDGSLDTTFSGDGKATVTFTADSDVAYALALQPDGKIVVGGDANLGTTTTGVDFAITRLLPDGSLDMSFNTFGLAYTAVGANSARDSIYALAIQTIGGQPYIVAAGGEGDFKLVRYRANGAVDTTFGTNGKVSGLYQSVIGAARAIAIAPSNHIFIAGHMNHDFALVELTDTGAVDPAFGRVITGVSSTNWDEAQAIVLDGEKPILAGWVYEGQSSAGNFALARYGSDGELDPTFNGGIVITPVAAGSRPDQATAMALQVDDRVPTVRAVVAGYANSANFDFAVARYWR